MKLEIKKSKKKGLTGKIKFSFSAMAILTSEEKRLIEEFNSGKIILFEFEKASSGVANVIGAGLSSTRLPSDVANIVFSFGTGKVSVNDLVHGKTVDCSDIQEIMAAEESMKRACQTLVVMLDEMKNYEGTEEFEFSVNVT